MLVRWIAARLPRPRNPLFRLALANLHRPGAQTGRLVVALGLGLTLFTTLAVIETNLVGPDPHHHSGQGAELLPSRHTGRGDRPLPRHGARGRRREGDLVTIPALRGAVVAVGDRRVAEMDEIPPEAWFLRGDRGLTYSADLPEGSRIVVGRMVAEGLSGPASGLARRRGGARGRARRSAIRSPISVLGREIEARIASLREINWDTMGFNFVIVFAPGALENAPHSFMATISMPEAQERGFSRAVANAFPSVSADPGQGGGRGGRRHARPARASRSAPPRASPSSPESRC